MHRRMTGLVLGLSACLVLALPAYAQSSNKTTAIDRLASRLKAMQSFTGDGSFLNTVDPYSGAHSSPTTDSSFLYTGFAARGLVKAYDALKGSSPADSSYLTAASSAFTGAYDAHGYTASSSDGSGLTWGDVLLGQELGRESGYSSTGSNASTEALMKAGASFSTDAQGTAAKIISDMSSAFGSESNAAWLAGLAAQALAREGSAEIQDSSGNGLGVTAGDVAAEIASQLDASYADHAFNNDGSAAMYTLGWSGIAIALAATGTDPTSGSGADYLSELQNIQDGNGFFDDTSLGGTGSDIFSGTAYGIMAMNTAMTDGYGTAYRNSMVDAGVALTNQLNDGFAYVDAYGNNLREGFSGYAGMGFPEYIGTTTSGFIEYGQYDGEALYGIAATPEPGTLALFGIGLLGLGLGFWRRKKLRAARA